MYGQDIGKANENTAQKNNIIMYRINVILLVICIFYRSFSGQCFDMGFRFPVCTYIAIICDTVLFSQIYEILSI